MAHSGTHPSPRGKKGKTVSLVLGSGGARGMAHVGVIRVLEERGFIIRSISGASIGALVGGVHAAGRLDGFAGWVSALDKMDILRLLDFSFSRQGLFRGEKVVAVLRELIGEVDIEKLPIRYTAVATDINNQREVWLNRGSLFDAIRASIAIPSIFTPVMYQGLQLMDGGILNPIPVGPTLYDTNDLTVAVTLCANLPEDPPPLSPPRPPEPPHGAREKVRRFLDELLRQFPAQTAQEDGYFEVMGKSLDAMQNSLAKIKLATYNPDLLVEIPRRACSFYQFDRAAEMIELGRRRAGAAVDRWLEEHPAF